MITYTHLFHFAGISLIGTGRFPVDSETINALVLGKRLDFFFCYIKIRFDCKFQTLTFKHKYKTIIYEQYL